MLDLELPSIRKTTTHGNYARYEIEPVDAGYALSLANGLRRVLLSSLEGSAITSLFIKGVQHEFQDIPDVKEDVTDLMLNLKKVRLRSYADRPVTVHLDIQGERVVKASDIKTSSMIEIVNPDLYLATLDNEHADLDMQLVVETGRGFVEASKPAEQDEEGPRIGVIPIDAVFCPVLHVNFIIEELYRDRWDRLDKIVLEVTTDGAISPDEALRQSASLLRQQFAVFANYRGESDVQGFSTDVSTILIPPHISNLVVDELQLSSRTTNAIKRSGITKVGQILEMDEHNLLSIKNFGEKGFRELGERLLIKGCLPKKEEIGGK